ncbi:MAG: UDP-2,3-diacylglucosamine diphosphatase LpxI [Candidatus Omnitrophota bacterium]
MKLGIIAGNRNFPLVLAQNIKTHHKDIHVTAFCFKGETSRSISRYVDTTLWLGVGKLGDLRDAILAQGVTQCIMAGQISPWRIFDKRHWDRELLSLVDTVKDFRPHAIFGEIIHYLEARGITFLDSTTYLAEYLATGEFMNACALSRECQDDVNYGVGAISRFVELDVGQTIVVKKTSVVALEALEGTDNTIKRGASIAGGGCVVLKFSKKNQDVRFDVPVVGPSTVRLLGRIRAAALVLECGRVLILEKEQFLRHAQHHRIAVIGAERKGS